MLGRQETEGVLGKSRTAGFTGLGVSSLATEQGECSRQWLALSRVQEIRKKRMNQHQPTEVDAVKS